MEITQIECDPWRHDDTVDKGPLLVCPDISLVPDFPWSLPMVSHSTSIVYTTFGQLKDNERYHDLHLKDRILSKQCDDNKINTGNELQDQSLLNQLRTDLPYILSKLANNEGKPNDGNECEVTKSKQIYAEGRHPPSFETDSLETASVIPHLSSNCSPDDILNARIESLSDDVFETESDTNRRLGIFQHHQHENNHFTPLQDLLKYSTNTVPSDASYNCNSGDLTSSDSVDISLSSGSYTIDIDLYFLPEFECAVDRRERIILSDEKDSFDYNLASQNLVRQSENTDSLVLETYLDGRDQDYTNSTDSCSRKEFMPAGREFCTNESDNDEKSNITGTAKSKVMDPCTINLGEWKSGSVDFLTTETEGGAPNNDFNKHTYDLNIDKNKLQHITNSENTDFNNMCFPVDKMNNKLSTVDENAVCIDLVGKTLLQENETASNKGSEVIQRNNTDTMGMQNASSYMSLKSKSLSVTLSDTILSQNHNKETKIYDTAHSMGLSEDLFHNHDSIDHKGFCKLRCLKDSSIVLKENMDSLTKEKGDNCSFIDKKEVKQFVWEVIHLAINRIKTEFDPLMEMQEPVSTHLPFITSGTESDHPCVLDDSAPDGPPPTADANNDTMLMDYCGLECFNEDLYTSSLAPIPEVDPILETYSLQNVFNDMHIYMASTPLAEDILPSIPEICNENTECLEERTVDKESAEDFAMGDNLQEIHSPPSNDSNKTGEDFAVTEEDVQNQSTDFEVDEELTNMLQPADNMQQVFGIRDIASKDVIDTLENDLPYNNQSLEGLEWLLKDKSNNASDENKELSYLLKENINMSDNEGHLNENGNDKIIEQTTTGSESDPYINPSVLNRLDQDEFAPTFTKSESEPDPSFRYLQNETFMADGQCSDKYSQEKSDKVSEKCHTSKNSHFASDTEKSQAIDFHRSSEQTAEIKTPGLNFSSDLKNVYYFEKQANISETVVEKESNSYEKDDLSLQIEDREVSETSIPKNTKHKEDDTLGTLNSQIINTSLPVADISSNDTLPATNMQHKTQSKSDIQVSSHSGAVKETHRNSISESESICSTDVEQGYIVCDNTDKDLAERVMNDGFEVMNVSKDGHFGSNVDDKSSVMENKTKELEINNARLSDTAIKTAIYTSVEDPYDFYTANEKDTSDVEQRFTTRSPASKDSVSSLDTEARSKAGLLSKILKSNLSNDLSRRPEYRRHSRYQSRSLHLDNSDHGQTDSFENEQLSLRKVKSLDTDDRQQYSSRKWNSNQDSRLYKFNTNDMYSARHKRNDEVDETEDYNDQVNLTGHEFLRQFDKENNRDRIDTSCKDTTNNKITDIGKSTNASATNICSNLGSYSQCSKTNNLQTFHSDIDRMYTCNQFQNEHDGKNFTEINSSPNQVQNQAGSIDRIGSLPLGLENSMSNYQDLETGDDGLSAAFFRSVDFGNMASANTSFDLKHNMNATNRNMSNEADKKRNAYKEGTFQVKRLSTQEFILHDYKTGSRLHSLLTENPSPDLTEYINAISLDEHTYDKRSRQDTFPTHLTQQLEARQEVFEQYKDKSPYDYYSGSNQNFKSYDHAASRKVKLNSSQSIDYGRCLDMSIQGRTTSAAKERKLQKSHSELSTGRQHQAVLSKSSFDDHVGLTSKQVKIDQFPKGKAVATRDRSLIDRTASQYFNQNNGRTGNNCGKSTDTDLAKKSRKTAGRNYRDNITGSQRRNKTFNSEMRILEHLERRTKDGPLSLTDAYGSMETNDNQTGHALSKSANHLSESMTSLSNRHAPAMSPSRQSTLQKQQSLQSFHSEINGEHRHEEGVKFERLKNLPEEDLMVKIKEIIGHMERLEDYHRGDGMRIQKMLGDMYWDYTHMREMIGDCMADSGYAVVSMTMLKTLNSIGIFKNDDVWFPTYYTYNTMWNFTDSSSKLAKALSENDAVRLLTLNCGHKPYINAIHSKNVYYVIKASLSILHNIARNSGMKHLFDENKTSETIMPFLESEDEMLKILATLTIANIVDEEENKTIIAESGTIHDIVNWIEKSLSLPRRRYKGFTPQELTEGLNKLAVNDTNKMRIVDEGALQLFLQMLQHDDIREQSSAARIVWTLSFDKDVRQKINENTELVSVMEKLTDSTNKSLQTNCSGVLWIIRGENDVTMEKRPKTNKSKTHVFLSYAWADKEIVLAIRDRLRAEGYAIWIDIEKMGKATLDTMTEAIENSAVVLVCMSEKYKQSPNCRTEAEYTFQLKKDYIPLMMQKKYRPDGWVGTILGAKLYFDFSGKYPFEKSFQGLLKELRGRGKVTPNTTPGENSENNHGNPAMVHSMSLSSHTSAGTPVHHMLNSAILNMGQEELIKWLRNIKLTECIPAFMEFDGRLLMQLKVMRSEAPEFFYQCLEKRLNMSLIEILKFTRALEELQ